MGFVAVPEVGVDVDTELPEVLVLGLEVLDPP